MEGKNWYIVYYANQYARTKLCYMVAHFKKPTKMNHEIAKDSCFKYHVSKILKGEAKKDAKLAKEKQGTKEYFSENLWRGELAVTPLSWAIENE